MSIYNKIKTLFTKDGSPELAPLVDNEVANFTLIVDGFDVGYLSCIGGQWLFQYSNEFKTNREEYYPIVGFPDINQTYKSTSLWPFFLIRIPGLKQPAIQELVKKESINPNSEVELLRFFGRKTIANPFELIYQA